MQTQLNIEGMTCQMCVQHVTKALLSTPGVIKAEVNLENKSAIVEGDHVHTDRLVEAVREEGYEAQISQ